MGDDVRVSLLRNALSMINIHFKKCSELYYQVIARDILLDSKVNDSLLAMRKVLKTAYHSDMLSCLHSNSSLKQRFPGVCMIRQLLKANGMYMRPKLESMGYDKSTGKKRIKRYYIITPI